MAKRTLFVANDGPNGAALWITDGTLAGTRLLKDIGPGFSSPSIASFTDLGNGKVVFVADNQGAGLEPWVTDGTPEGTMLLANIGTGVDGSSPSNFVRFGTKIAFTANSTGEGAELWVTDGTPAGTTLLKDIEPGANGSFPVNGVAVGDRMFFAASTAANGFELWVTDGTTAGTRLVKDILSGSGSAGVSAITALGNKVVFNANDGTSGSELWISDGTEAGTTRVADLFSGTTGSSPWQFSVLGDKLVFAATTAAGTEVWATDGTAAGTVLVKDINPGSPSSSPISFVKFGNLLAFPATDAANGRELWVTDGTEAGTVRISDIGPGAANGSPNMLRPIGDKLVFTASNATEGFEVWVTDGTLAGTILLKDINPGSGGSGPDQLTVVGNRVVFSATGPTGGREPWVTDGTPAGTMMLADINPTGESAPGNYTRLGDKLIFQANDGVNGTEAWITDGTPAGTMLLDVPDERTDSAAATGLVAFGSGVAYRASMPGAGQEPYVTDGTAAGSFRLGDINPGTGNSGAVFGPNAGGLSYFAAIDGETGFELYKTDGTAAGTSQVKDINVGSSSGFSSFGIALGSKLLFAAIDGAGIEPWVSDGTAAGTVRLLDINAGSNSSPTNWTLVGTDKVVFSATSNTVGSELYVTDGTPGGTTLLKDINAGSGNSAPSLFVSLGSQVAFRATTAAEGIELWFTDGTAAGTRLVKDIAPGTSSSSAQNLKAFGSRVLFSASDNSTGLEPWISDGTDAGTFRLGDLNPGGTSSGPASFTVLGSKILFSANGGSATGAELYITDGTVAGTSLLKDIFPGATSSAPQFLTSIGDKVLFRASSLAEGQDLWVTDGTAAGTVALDVAPGTANSGIGTIVSIGAKAVFAATAAESGQEIWVSDGTAAGTFMLKDIAPGASGSSVSSITRVGDKAYFIATDGYRGTEVWVTDGTSAGTMLATDTNAVKQGSGATGFFTFDAVEPNAAPTLAGLDTVTFAEDTVKATPQLIDADVTVVDDGNIANGRVTVSGLLAEDRVAIRNEGAGTGQIGISGNTVSFGGVAIGTFTGGTGATFTVALNGSATVTAVDALIQNLTYANVSDAPTAARTLRINIIDGAGAAIGNPASFSPLTGAANPFGAFDVGLLSKPTFLDFDNDGDLDMVSGEEQGGLFAFRNNGNGTYTQLTGTANPFAAIDVGIDSTPAAADLDGDGDLDLLIGENDGFFNAQRNNGNGTFVGPIGVTGLTGVDFGTDTVPAFVDFDGDGDLDVVSGETNGTLFAFRNNGNGSYTQLTGGANPFNGIDVGTISAPSFVDFDADGDSDALIGEVNGTALAYRNNGDGTFTNVTGAANPFNGLNAGFDVALAFTDLDGDGDLDAVSGGRNGTFLAFRNDSTNGVPITVNVTAQNDAPTTANLQGDVVSYTEQLGQKLLDAGSNATIADPDSGNFNGGSLRVQITAGLQAGIDVIFFVGNGRVSLSSQSAGATVFVQLASDPSPVAIGTLANENLFQNNTVINFTSDDATPARVQELLRSISYNGNSDTLISGQRTITYTLNDGDGGVGTTTSFLNVTAVNDVPTVTVSGSVTFTESVNGASTPVVVASGVFVADVDNTTLASATVTISANREATDLLAFTNTNSTTFGNVAASYDNATGVLTLTSAGATATKAQFQSALRAVTFTSTSEEPSTAARTVSFIVNDGAANSTAGTRQILVQANNDAPSGTSQTLTINEDQIRALGASDFGFTDVDGDAFAGVRFSAAPTGGTLFYDADGPGVSNAPVAITTFPTTTYTAADLAAGRVTFVPTANLNGSAVATISFSVVDDGGTVGAGINTDPTPNTLTFTITPQADAPVSADASATLPEDGAYVFTLADFPFSDADGDTLYSIIVNSHPAIGAGGLFFDPGGVNGGNRTDLRTFGTGFQVFASDIASGKLFYIPAANGNGPNYASFLFNVRSDNQGSGVYDSAQQTFTFNVTPVNDAPTLTGLLASATVDENYVNSPVGIDNDVTLVDLEGNLANGSVTVSGLLAEDRITLRNIGNGAGQIVVDGNNVSYAGVVIGTLSGGVGNTFTVALNGAATVAAVEALIERVTYQNVSNTPTPNRTLSFQVTDGAGAASVPATLALTVTPQNDAPVRVVQSATVDEGGVLVLGASTLDYDDPEQSDSQITYYVNALPSHGVLLLNGVSLNVNDTFTQADVNAGNVRYGHDNSDTTTDSFGFSVTDRLGGSVSGEVFTISVNPLQEAPALDLDAAAGGTGVTVIVTEGDIVNPAATATVSDIDSANFDGGTLTVGYGAATTASDSVFVTDEGGQFASGGRIGVSVSSVYYNTVLIGTISSSGLGQPLVVTLNASATPAAVQRLVQQVNTINISDAPPTGARSLTYTLTDGDGGSTSAIANVTINGQNDAPTIANLQGNSGTITEAASTSTQFVLIDAGGDALVTDLDSADFNGGTLDIRISSGFVAGEDRLGFQGDARVSVAGNFVLVDGQAVGTFTGGGPGQNFLTLAFDSAISTPDRVEAVLRAVFQSNTAVEPTAGVRGLTVTLTDGDGGTASATSSVTVVNVNDAPVFGGGTGAIARVTTLSDGTQTNGNSLNGSFSADGTRVLFTSAADNLIAGDTNSLTDLFVKDLATGAFTRVNTDAGGNQANGTVSSPVFSASGTRVAFISGASNLVAGDTNSLSDVFVKDLTTGEVFRATTNAVGTEMTSGAIHFVVSISADGRYVAFATNASDLVPGDTNAANDIFVKDLLTGAIVRVNTDANGAQANGSSINPVLSPDGRSVAFVSTANNLVPGDTDNLNDIFVKNLDTGAIVRIGIGIDGLRPSGSLTSPVFSRDGSQLAFVSTASNLVAGDTNGTSDLFVMNLATGVVTRVNTTSSGEEVFSSGSSAVFSPDGTRIAFLSASGELVPGDTNFAIDVFVKDLITGNIVRVSISEGGAQGDASASTGLSFSPDGTRLLFNSGATTLAPGDTNGYSDVFIKDLSVAPRYIEDGAPVQIVSSVALSDFDSADFAGGALSVTVTAGGRAGDRLSIASTGTSSGIAVVGASVRYNGVEIGVLSGSGASISIALDGDATVVTVKALVAALRFDSTSGDPGSATRTISLSLSDGDGGTTGFTTNLAVTPANDAPVIANLQGDTVTFTEGPGDVLTDVGANLTITDADSANFDTGTLTIRVVNKVATEDQIVFDAGNNPALAGYQAAAGVLYFDTVAFGTISTGGVGIDRVITFNANATAAIVQGFVRGTYYLNTNQGNPSTAQRTIEYVLTDGDGGSTTVTSLVSVVGVNDAPFLNVSGGATVPFVEGKDVASTPIVVDAGISVLDSDSPTLGTARVYFGSTYQSGADILAMSATSGIGNIVAVFDATTGFLDLTSAGRTATLAEWQAALRSVTYTNLSDTPDVANRAIRFVASDGVATSLVTGRTVTVTAADDSPVAVADPVATAENAVLSGVLTTNDTDVDGGPKTITAVNGVAGAVGSQVTLSSGAKLTVLADGSYSYDPTGAFAYLVSPASAASNGAQSSATDSFTYTLRGGSTATVTVTVTGVDGAGDQLRGSTGNNIIQGTPAPDYINISQGGADVVNAGTGDDTIFTGAGFSADDTIDGGPGTDQISLRGSYIGSLGNVTNTEFLGFLSGTSTRFGGDGTARYNYDVTTTDATVASDVAYVVQANELVAGENLRFDGSAETNGSFIIYAGKGVDTFIGGAGNDGFFFGEGGRFTAADTVNGGLGTADQLGLRGNYTVTFGATTMTGIETIVFLSASQAGAAAEAGNYSYALTLDNANVGAGQTLRINAAQLGAGEVANVIGSSETDGTFFFIGGLGNDSFVGGAGADTFYGGGGIDSLTGGLGNDVFQYRAVAESAPGTGDTITDFQVGDRIDLSVIDAIFGTPGTNDAFSFVTGAFTAAGQVRVEDLGGGVYRVEADIDGGGADFAITVTSDHAITAADFIL